MKDGVLEYRGDTVGAINLVLEGAPYGPNVEEAKVCYPVFLHVLHGSRVLMNNVTPEPQPPNININPQQYESVRDP